MVSEQNKVNEMKTHLFRKEKITEALPLTRLMKSKHIMYSIMLWEPMYGKTPLKTDYTSKISF